MMVETGNRGKEAGERKAKKLDEFRNSEENKRAIADSEGKIEPSAVEESVAPVEKMQSSVGAAPVETTKSSVDKKENKEKKVDLEREYVVPLKRGVLKVPRYRRAKKAVRVLKEFIVRHMNVRDGDLKKVKIDRYLNNEIWFRGIKKPMNKVRVRAKKVGDIVHVELAELPEAVRFVKAREEKAKEKAEKAKVKKPKKVETEDKSEESKAEEKEDAAAGTEKAVKVQKAAAKSVRHTTKGAHGSKVQPVRKALKK